MRRLRCSVVGWALLYCVTQSVSAQNAPAVDSPAASGRATASAPPTNPDGSTSASPRAVTTGPVATGAVCCREIVPTDVAQVELALGRIHLTPHRFRVVSKHETFPEEECSRSYQVSAATGEPALNASLKSHAETWTLKVDPVTGVQWTRTFRQADELVTVEYDQCLRCPVRIKVKRCAIAEAAGAGGATAKGPEIAARTDHMEGLTLWHLVERNDPVFCDYVLPSLVRLNPKWNLPKILATAKAELALEAEIDAGSSKSNGSANATDEGSIPAQVARSLAELDSHDQAVRNAATRELRELGLAAQIPLTQALSGSISMQQRQTILSLLDTLEPKTADTPTRIAYWLSGDPSWR